MDEGMAQEQHVPSGQLMGIQFGIWTEADLEKYSVIEITANNDVTSSKLGMPNQSLECSTCGATDTRICDGHFGIIKFPMDVLHPYLISVAVQILNKICPGCKTIRVPEDHTAAETSSQPKGCKYCVKQAKSMPWYPKFKFKTATKSTVVVVEVNERIPMRFKNKSLGELLPDDYWDFIPKDPEPEESCLKSNMRTLSTPQVYLLLKDVEQKFVEKLALRAEYLFLTCLPVTPNCNRVMEATQVYGMSFDERTKAYKKLVDSRISPTDHESRVRDCFRLCKLNTERPKKYENELNTEKSKKNEMKGSKWMKNTVLSKRTDNALRMTVVGDPNIKLGEIGLPRHIADKLEIPENLNSVNWVNLNACCSLRLLEKGELKTRREGRIIHVNHMNKVQVGDTVYRPLEDGDIVLINRPPSIHQHAIIAFTVKVLPTTAVMSLNPVCCSPFRGDFDGDCLHGFIPQSMESRVELKELVALNRQVLNGQNGRNLLSLCHDSLSAAYLVKEKGVFLNKFQMQQLLLMCPRQLFSPAILNTNQNQTDTSLSWTGSQLLSMLLPQCLNYKLPSSGKGIHVSKGEIMSSSPDCTWLQDKDENLFSSLIKHYGDKVLDFMFHIQEVLLEWISMRGLSVSLSDLYLSPDSNLREKMVEEVRYGLQDAEQSCHLKQLVMDSRMNTMDCVEEDQTVKDLELSLNKNNVGAFKEVFRNVQNLPFRYASRDNSLLSMVKAGSKGNLSKLVQQSLCVGLQQPSIPLSFRVPSQLSCASWNHQKLSDLHQKAHCIPESSVPYALVKSSFISGLNPLECFVHSLSSRDSSFSDNADLPGTLSRKLMSYMRDIYKAYDGTVRSSYGNQLVQFSYANRDKNSIQEDTHSFSGKSVNSLVDFGSPVGSLAACSISEAAYGALDQPIGTLETSPLVNLKKVLESGQKKVKRDQSISLFLSKEAIRWHGMEHASLKVKSHLERVLFSDVVSTVMIFFSEQISNTMRFSPWVCHFHISKERMDRRGLNEQSIRDALNTDCEKARVKAKFCIPKLRILSSYCFEAVEEEENNDTICITVEFETSKDYPVLLDDVRDLIPFLLERVIKGFLEFKKVDILWGPTPSTSNKSSCALYLKVFLLEKYGNESCWNLMVKKSLMIADLIDWRLSQPDDIYDVFCVYGISSASTYFLRSLESATSAIGRTILPEHLQLVADALSVTGELFGLSPKGISKQMDLTSTPSPFAQACFSLPRASFIKAAKKESRDDLLGTLDAIAWGKKVPVGTGRQFDLIYSPKGHELAGPVNVYDKLSTQLNYQGKPEELMVPDADKTLFNNLEAESSIFYCDPKLKGHILKAFTMERLWKDILDMSVALQFVLHKSSIDEHLDEDRKFWVMEALRFHPRCEEKLGTGVQEIKVAYHPKHQRSRCFMLVRTDGTSVDFSYRKCVLGAAKDKGLSAELIQRLSLALFSTESL